MPRPMMNLLGQTFGELTVLAHAGKDKNRHNQWLCACSCGERPLVLTSSLTLGLTRSCGHLHRDLCRASSTHDGHAGYLGVHQSVRRRYGKPADYMCVQCGVQARVWSLDPWAEYLTDEKNRRYSIDTDAYSPRCQSCNLTLDAQFRRMRENMSV